MEKIYLSFLYCNKLFEGDAEYIGIPRWYDNSYGYHSIMLNHGEVYPVVVKTNPFTGRAIVSIYFSHMSIGQEDSEKTWIPYERDMVFKEWRFIKKQPSPSRPAFAQVEPDISVEETALRPAAVS